MPLNDNKLNILLLADTGHPANAVKDHIQAVTQHSNFNWIIENPLKSKVLHKINLSAFAAIGIHYSIKAYSNYYLSKELVAAIIHFKGTKFIFLQDEYAHVKDNIEAMVAMNIDILFTLVTESEMAKAYGDDRLKHIKKITVLTAYAPEITCDTKPYSERNIDIFYRSRPYPFWLGELAQERITIANKTQSLASHYSLNTDISLDETKRLYGDAWFDALLNAKAVLGTESGASVWDYDGKIEKNTKKYLARHHSADFKQVQAAVLQVHENTIRYACISPRIFEAALTKTVMIMFAGYYNGLLLPDIHYIELKRDFSNFKSIVAKLNDVALLDKISDRAYTDLIASERYAAKLLASTVDQAVSELIKKYSNDITAKIDNEFIKQKYKFVNYLHLILEETRFMFANLYAILTDERYPAVRRLTPLLQGLKRYFIYIIARYKSN